MNIRIKRVGITNAGCFGVLLINEIPICVTLEHTYENNLVKIPVGEYKCTKSHYHKGGYNTYEIKVPGHERILFHKGNVENDLDGCIAIGENFGFINNQPAILQSGNGFIEFITKLNGVNEFLLKVE